MPLTALEQWAALARQDDKARQDLQGYLAGWLVENLQTKPGGPFRGEVEAQEAWRQPAEATHADLTDLSQSGWGVIFAAKDERASEIIAALAPLLQRRRQQATRLSGNLYREFTGSDGYRPGESASGFLRRYTAYGGQFSPELMPYYLLLVGSPEEIPFSFQQQLSQDYAVGRLHFDGWAGYARYAQAVVQSEEGSGPPLAEALLFGPQNPGDPHTTLTGENLLRPLASQLASSAPERRVNLMLEGQASKELLVKQLEHGERPALLLAAAHGLGFPPGHSGQPLLQGGWVCQEWPGSWWADPLPETFTFTAADITGRLALPGSIVLSLASYSAGTDRFDRLFAGTFHETIPVAPQATVSPLAQRWLGHEEGGALAFLGYIDRAWGYPFTRAGSVEPQLLEEQRQLWFMAAESLLKGLPAGLVVALQGQRLQAERSRLEELRGAATGQATSDMELAVRWLSLQDAGNFALIGDPAARLPVAPPATATQAASKMAVSPPPVTEGWVWARHLAVSGDQGTVGQFGLNLRTAPQREAERLGLVRPGAQVAITGRQEGEFLPVRVPDRDLDTTPPVPGKPPLPIDGLVSLAPANLEQAAYGLMDVKNPLLGEPERWQLIQELQQAGLPAETLLVPAYTLLGQGQDSALRAEVSHFLAGLSPDGSVTEPARALLENSAGQAVADLAPLLESLGALAGQGDDGALQLLPLGLEDRRITVRRAAAQALAQLDPARVAPTLLAAIGEGTAVLAGLEALLGQSGRRGQADSETWQAWLVGLLGS